MQAFMQACTQIGRQAFMQACTQAGRHSCRHACRHVNPVLPSEHSLLTSYDLQSSEKRKHLDQKGPLVSL